MRNLVLSIVMASLLVGLSALCGNAQTTSKPAESGIITKSAVSDEVSINFSCFEIFYSGSENYVIVTLRNDGDEPVSFDVRGETMGVAFHVIRQGDKVARTAWGEARYGPQLSNPGKALLEKGKQIQVILNVSRYYDLSVTGEYEISALWTAVSANKKTVINLKTPPIKLKVTAKDPPSNLLAASSQPAK